MRRICGNGLCRSVVTALACLVMSVPLGLASPAGATVFQVQGGSGDWGGQLRCPQYHVMVGLTGRAGNWVDRVAIICARVLDDYSVTGRWVSVGRGGTGGGAVEQYCEPGAGVRQIQPSLTDPTRGEPNLTVLAVRFVCAYVDSGVITGDHEFGDFNNGLAVGIQTCPPDEFATGVTLHFGRYVDAIGLICGPVERNPPFDPHNAPILHIPAAPPPHTTAQGPIVHVGRPPNQAMTGVFDTDFGKLFLNTQGGTFSQKNGQVTVTRIDGWVMQGVWRQSTAARQCADGGFWGRFTFTFTSSAFTGSYSYCNDTAPAGRWNGVRVGDL